MKPREEGGVVDQRLNVHGTQNLKCADLSICPVRDIVQMRVDDTHGLFTRIILVPTHIRLLCLSARKPQVSYSKTSVRTAYSSLTTLTSILKFCDKQVSRLGCRMPLSRTPLFRLANPRLSSHASSSSDRCLNSRVQMPSTSPAFHGIVKLCVSTESPCMIYAVTSAPMYVLPRQITEQYCPLH